MFTMIDIVGAQSDTDYAAIRKATELKLITSGFEPWGSYDGSGLLTFCPRC